MSKIESNVIFLLPLNPPFSGWANWFLVDQIGAQEIDHDGARDDENGEEVVMMTVNATVMMVTVSTGTG